MLKITQYGTWRPLKQERRLGPHRNAGLELVYLARGEVTWDYAGRLVRVRPPAVSFALPWQLHSSATATVPSCELYWAVLPLDGVYAEEPVTCALHRSVGLPAAAATALVETLRRAPHPVVPAAGLLGSVMVALLEELGGAAQPERVRCLAQLAVVEVARAVGQQVLPAPPQSAEERVREFLHRLRRECHQPWTLGTMAAACGLGRTQFAEHLKTLTGDTPVQLLNRLRVDLACRRLVQTELGVTEIAFAAGFSSSQYFARVFRAYTGGSAQTWRTTAREHAVRRGASR